MKNPAQEKVPAGRTVYLRRALKGEPLKDILIIDHHGHFGWGAVDGLLDEEAVDIISVMDSIGVDRAVIYSVGFDDYHSYNDLTIKGVAMQPERFIGYAFIKMDAPDKIVRELNRCKQAGMKGLKLHSFFDCEPFTSNKFRPVWEFCAQNSWPVIIHGFDPQLAYDYPDIIFIGAHNIERIFSPEAIKAMQECPNYYWCTSSTMTVMGAIEKAVSIFGADRLIFGSDLPGNNLATRLGTVLSARISEEDMRKILGGNIARLLNLKIKNYFPK